MTLICVISGCVLAYMFFPLSTIAWMKRRMVARYEAWGALCTGKRKVDIKVGEPKE